MFQLGGLKDGCSLTSSIKVASSSSLVGVASDRLKIHVHKIYPILEKFGHVNIIACCCLLERHVSMLFTVCSTLTNSYISLVVLVVPTIVFKYTCHHDYFTLYNKISV